MVRLVKYVAISVAVLIAVVAVWAGYMYVANIQYAGSVEKVSFHSGDDVTIRGWFIVPDKPGPHPAVVLLHGSGPLTGDQPVVRVFANAFLKSGFSVLTYDKRGVGSSGGTFNHNGYDDFIDDGINAVRYLTSRSDVDPRSIGLLGSSEGGWFAPEIAVRTAAIAFIVNRAGPPLPWIDTNLWEDKHHLIDNGLPNDLVEEAIQLRGLILRFLVEVNANPMLVESPEWHRIDAEIDAFKQKYGQDEAWLKQDSLRFGMLADGADFWKTRNRALSYDPQPFIEQIDIPMLFIFAENDRNVPTAASVKYLESLQAQSHKNIEIRVIPGVEHSMLSPAAFIHGSHPEFINVIGPWASSKVPR